MKKEHSISYKGFANIHLYKNGNIVRLCRFDNSGTYKLFDLLAQCLCGHQVYNSMPHYLDLGYIDSSEDDKFVSVLNSRVPLSSNHTTNITSGSDVILVAAVFTANVPANKLLSGVSLSITTLRLYSEYNPLSDDTALAEILLSNNDAISFGEDNNYALMVEWIMTFGNVISSN